MDIDFAGLTEYQRYKLMASLIVPRPIALITTLGPTGVVNAAPFSMFNMLGEEPPIVMVELPLMATAGTLVRSPANFLTGRPSILPFTTLSRGDGYSMTEARSFMLEFQL